MSPQNSHAEVLTPRTSEQDLTGKWVLADVIGDGHLEVTLEQVAPVQHDYGRVDLGSETQTQ